MSLTNRVVPAILTDSPAALVKMARSVESFTDWVQIDIMDGLFVPSHSIDASDIAASVVKIGWEAHLMVHNPEKHLLDYKRAGAKRIIVHYETVKKNAADIIENISSMGMKAGLALNPETGIGVLNDNLVSRLKTVLFMAVHPGFYGAKFIPETLDKIVEFKRRFPAVSAGIDGGVKANNIEQVARTGVNEICVGSAIFAQPDPVSAYEELSKLARLGWDKAAV